MHIMCSTKEKKIISLHRLSLVNAYLHLHPLDCVVKKITKIVVSLYHLACLQKLCDCTFSNYNTRHHDFRSIWYSTKSCSLAY